MNVLEYAGKVAFLFPMNIDDLAVKTTKYSLLHGMPARISPFLPTKKNVPTKKRVKTKNRWPPPVFLWKQVGPRQEARGFLQGPRSPGSVWIAVFRIRMYLKRPILGIGILKKKHNIWYNSLQKVLVSTTFLFTPAWENNLYNSIPYCFKHGWFNRRISSDYIQLYMGSCFEGCQFWCAKMILAGRKSHIDLHRFDGQGAVPEVGCSSYGVVILEQPVRSHTSGVFKKNQRMMDGIPPLFPGKKNMEKTQRLALDWTKILVLKGFEVNVREF